MIDDTANWQLGVCTSFFFTYVCRTALLSSDHKKTFLSEFVPCRFLMPNAKGLPLRYWWEDFVIIIVIIVIVLLLVSLYDVLCGEEHLLVGIGEQHTYLVETLSGLDGKSD